MKSLFSFISFFLFSVTVVSAQMTVTGNLLGHDGKPMIKADVVLKDMMQDKPVKIFDVAENGKYNISIDSLGIWRLIFSGVNHSSHEVVLYLDAPEKFALDVQLKTYDYVDSIREVRIDGPFNGYDAQSALPLQKQPDGTFTGEFETKADTFGYEIVGITKAGHTINGTQSERYECDWGGDYTSIVTPTNGKARIIFDPTKLVRSTEPVKVTFADPQSFNAKIAQLYDEIKNNVLEYSKAMSEFRESGKGLREFKYLKPGLVDNILSRIALENHTILRGELYMDYLVAGAMTQNVDTMVVRRMLTEIPPSSILWTINPSLIFGVILGYAVQPAQAGYGYVQNYVQNVLEENPSSELKAFILWTEYRIAKYNNDSSKAATCYDMLANKYGNTTYGKMTRDNYPRNPSVNVRKPAPAFSIVSLEDSTKFYTNNSFKGKYLLVDFWATWCAPCVGEMDYLHKAYERFKDKNFAMLSVSRDISPQDVLKFRNDKWKMPWLHAFAGDSDNKMVKDFETIGIPHPILVDTTGTIVAMDEDLRGENLEKTLEKYLGK